MGCTETLEPVSGCRDWRASPPGGWTGARRGRPSRRSGGRAAGAPPKGRRRRALDLGDADTGCVLYFGGALAFPPLTAAFGRRPGAASSASGGAERGGCGGRSRVPFPLGAVLGRKCLRGQARVFRGCRHTHTPGSGRVPELSAPPRRSPRRADAESQAAPRRPRSRARGRATEAAPWPETCALGAGRGTREPRSATSSRRGWRAGAAGAARGTRCRPARGGARLPSRRPPTHTLIPLLPSLSRPE